MNPRSKDNNIDIDAFDNLMVQKVMHNEESNLAPKYFVNTLPFLGPLAGGENYLDGRLDLIPGYGSSYSSYFLNTKYIGMMAVTGMCSSDRRNLLIYSDGLYEGVRI